MLTQKNTYIIKKEDYLHNNFPVALEYKGREWKSVTNFVYGMSLGGSETHIVKKAKPTQAMELFKTFKKKEDQQLMIEALVNALEVNITPEVSQLLLATKNNFLNFEADPQDALLQYMNRDNTMGQVFSVLRHKLVMKMKQKAETNLYEAYKAIKKLQYLMSLGKDIRQYNKADAKEINRKITVAITFPEKNLVVDLYCKGKLKNPILNHELKEPGNLASLVRCNNISSFKMIRLKQRRLELLKLYLEYRYQEYQKDKKYSEFENAFSLAEQEHLEEIVVFLYEQKSFIPSLQEKMKKTLETISIPSEKEIEEARKIIKSVNAKHWGNLNIRCFKHVSSSIITINSSQKPFSLLYYLPYQPVIIKTQLLTQKPLPSTLSFSSSFHYFLALKISFTLNTSLQEANQKLPDDLLEAFNIEQKIEFEDRKQTLEKYLKIALSLKFKKRAFKERLALTGSKNLIFENDDLILGKSQGEEGLNLTGKYLETLRSSKLTGLQQSVSLDQLLSIFNDDGIVKNWAVKTYNNMKMTVMILKNYIQKLNLQKNIRVGPDLVETVLETFYSGQKVVDAKIPGIPVKLKSLFNQELELYRDQDNLEHEVRFHQELNQAIWKRIFSIIYNISQKVKNLTKLKIISFIKRVEDQKPNSDFECETILRISTPMDNCIVSAVLNLLKKVHGITQKYTHQPILSVDDIEIALQVLVNTTQIKYDKSIETVRQLLTQEYLKSPETTFNAFKRNFNDQSSEMKTYLLFVNKRKKKIEEVKTKLEKTKALTPAETREKVAAINQDLEFEKAMGRAKGEEFETLKQEKMKLIANNNKAVQLKIKLNQIAKEDAWELFRKSDFYKKNIQPEIEKDLSPEATPFQPFVFYDEAQETQNEDLGYHKIIFKLDMIDQRCDSQELAPMVINTIEAVHSYKKNKDNTLRRVKLFATPK